MDTKNITEIATVGEKINVLESVVRAEVRNRLENQRKNMEWCVGVWQGLEEKLQKEEEVMKLICGTKESCTMLLDKIKEKMKDEETTEAEGTSATTEANDKNDKSVCHLLFELLNNPHINFNGSTAPTKNGGKNNNAAAKSPTQQEIEQFQAKLEEYRAKFLKTLEEAATDTIANTTKATAAAAAANLAAIDAKSAANDAKTALTAAEKCATEAKSALNASIVELRRVVEAESKDVRRMLEIESKLISADVSMSVRKSVEDEVKECRRTITLEVKESVKKVSNGVREAKKNIESDPHDLFHYHNKDSNVGDEPRPPIEAHLSRIDGKRFQ